MGGFYGLRFAEVPASYGEGSVSPFAPDIDIVVYDRANDFRPQDLGGRAYRASHLIRDPRDVVVSGYHYHRRTDETWVHEPSDRYGGLSYQAFLLGVDEHDGLMAEIDRCARSSVAEMDAWSYGQPESSSCATKTSSVTKWKPSAGSSGSTVSTRAPWTGAWPSSSSSAASTARGPRRRSPCPIGGTGGVAPVFRGRPRRAFQGPHR